FINLKKEDFLLRQKINMIEGELRHWAVVLLFWFGWWRSGVRLSLAVARVRRLSHEVSYSFAHFFSFIPGLSIVSARVSHSMARLLESIARVHTIGMKVFCHRRKPTF